MSIKSELEKTTSYLREIRQAILNKGAEISSTAGLKDVPSAIATIPSDALTEYVGSGTFSAPFSGWTNAQINGIFRYNTLSKITTMAKVFTGNTSLITLPRLNVKNAKIFRNTLQDCTALTTVEELDIRTATTFSSVFSGCTALTNLNLKNIKVAITVGSGDTYGHLLTVDSLVGLCYELRDTGTTKKLTMGTTNLEKLANVYVKQIEITDGMRAEDEFIDEKLPFVVCESTDEGATLISDYVVLKHWSLV